MFNEHCIGCHAGIDPNAELDLSVAASYAAVVSRRSREVPGLDLVRPGDVAGSFLFEKINCALPQVGTRMPTAYDLGLSERVLLREWIEQGARAELRSTGEPLFETDFGRDDGGFTFVTDAFGGTNGARYASGTRRSSGGFDGAALEMRLGGVDNASVDAISAAWQRVVHFPSETQAVVSFRYRIDIEPAYDGGEFVDVLARFDGELLDFDGRSYASRVSGGDGTSNATSSLWRAATVALGTVSAGAHTLTIGAYNNRKDSTDEFATLLIDDVEVLDQGGSRPRLDVFDVRVAEINFTSATIEWTTDRLATSSVQYGTGVELEKTAAVRGTRGQHSVVLTDLRPGTAYRFRAASTAVDGARSSSSIGFFRTRESSVIARDSGLLASEQEIVPNGTPTPALSFGIAAPTAEGLRVSSLSVTAIGTSDLSGLDAVEVYRDRDRDGRVDSADDLLAVDSFRDDNRELTLEFDSPLTLAESESGTLLVALSVAEDLAAASRGSASRGKLASVAAALAVIACALALLTLLRHGRLPGASLHSLVACVVVASIFTVVAGCGGGGGSQSAAAGETYRVNLTAVAAVGLETSTALQIEGLPIDGSLITVARESAPSP